MNRIDVLIEVIIIENRSFELAKVIMIIDFLRYFLMRLCFGFVFLVCTMVMVVGKL